MTKQLAIRLAIISFLAFVLGGCSYMLPYRDDFQCQKGKNSGVCGSVSEVYDLSSDMDDLRLRTLDGKNEKEIEEAKSEEQKKALELAKLNFKQQKLQEMVEATEIRQIQNENPVIFNFYLDDNANKTLVANNTGAKNAKTNGGKGGKKNAGKKGNGAKGSKANGKNAQKSTKGNNAAKNSTANAGVDANSTLDNNSSLKNYVDTYIAGLDDNASKDTNASYGNDLNSTLAGANLGDMNATKDSNASNDLQNMLDEAYAKGQASVDCATSKGGKRTEINANVKVCVYAANIRKEPSCKAQVLRIANNGEVLFALYEQDGWVRLNDGTYIHKSIVTQD